MFAVRGRGSWSIRIVGRWRRGTIVVVVVVHLKKKATYVKESFINKNTISSYH
jgi:hypothetical protein